MFKKAWKWLKKYHTTILTFLFILGMGAGIAPTIKHGEAFIAAIQYERMVETSPRHAIVRGIEANYNVYIPAIDASEDYAVAWILQQGDMENTHEFLYDLFTALGEQFPNREAYYIVVAEVAPVKGIDGECTVIRGTAEYGVTNLGMQKLRRWGRADAENSLDTLYGEEAFWAIPYYSNYPYLPSVLQREAGHIPPWEAE